ncbi:MAG: hypothetical protein IJY05_03100 [Clostridia bacterium]|nr:hypothetical protein [Clostridia bacterium]
MGKYIDCKDCQNQYDCERTYLGGCTDGKEWENKTAKAFVEGWEQRKAELKEKKEKVIKIIKNWIGGLDERIVSGIADEIIKSGLIENKIDTKQKAEIERLKENETELQELNAKYYNEAKDLRRKNAERQKQVDELTAKNMDLHLDKQELMNEISERKNDYARLNEAYVNLNNLYQQAVKDTAKKIYGEIDDNDILIVNTQEYGEIEVVSIERLKEIVKSKGVEVE